MLKMEFGPKNSVRITSVKTIHSTEPDQSTRSNIPSTKFNFAYSLLPLYYFSRVFGLLPFTILYDTNGDVRGARVTLFDIFWFIISVCIFLSLAVFSYSIINLPDGPNESPTLILGDYILLIVGLFYGAAIIVYDMCNRLRLIDIIKKFTIFDKEVNAIFSLNTDFY